MFLRNGVISLIPCSHNWVKSFCDIYPRSTDELAKDLLDQFWDRLTVIDIPRRNLHAQQLAILIDDQMHFEANWLQVLGPTKFPQVNERKCHKFESEMTLLKNLIT